jgi:putative membrane protein
MTNDEVSEPDSPLGVASRRTQFAEERTLLAWWRTGIAAAAVALAVGGLLPKLGDLPRPRFLALAAGYGILSLFFVIGGTIRGHLARQALAHRGFSAVSEWVILGVTVYISALVVLTVIALL